MDIVTRNFLRLLRTGLFAKQEDIEPLSPWKWHRISQMATMHDVVAIMHRGICRCSAQFFVQPPQTLASQWQAAANEQRQQQQKKQEQLAAILERLAPKQLRPVLIGPLPMSQLYDHPSDRSTSDIDFFFPYDTPGTKADKWAMEQDAEATRTDSHTLAYTLDGVRLRHQHRLLPLCNAFHSHTLQSIVEEEFREQAPTYISICRQKVEVVSPTLALLRLMLLVSADLLSGAPLLSHLADMAVFLRAEGDKVDYVKLQQWISRLRIGPMAQLEGSLLQSFLGFTPDEVPFMEPDEQFNAEPFAEALCTAGSADGWHFRQLSGNVFVSAVGSKDMFRQVRNSARNLRYYPTEGIAVLAAAFTRSLSDIEE